MTWTVETFCGRKRWLRSAYTFTAEGEAGAYLRRLHGAETKAELYRFMRRVVRF